MGGGGRCVCIEAVEFGGGDAVTCEEPQPHFGIGAGTGAGGYGVGAGAGGRTTSHEDMTLDPVEQRYRSPLNVQV